MGDLTKRAEIEFLQQRINDMAHSATLWQLRKIYKLLCTYLGEEI